MNHSAQGAPQQHVITPSRSLSGANSQKKMVDTLKKLVFHGSGNEDSIYKFFVCELVWATNNVQDDATTIVQPETTFRDSALT